MDRLWPHGVSEQDAALDEWQKDVAPTLALQETYGQQPGRFLEFQRRYVEELERSPARQAVDHILDIAHTEEVILLTATQDTEQSAARVLLEYLHNAPVRDRPEVVDNIIDSWGRDSFPASDPPGSLPPTIAGSS